MGLLTDQIVALNQQSTHLDQQLVFDREVSFLDGTTFVFHHDLYLSLQLRLQALVGVTVTREPHLAGDRWVVRAGYAAQEQVELVLREHRYVGRTLPTAPTAPGLGSLLTGDPWHDDQANRRHAEQGFSSGLAELARQDQKRRRQGEIQGLLGGATTPLSALDAIEDLRKGQR
jgi:hypothetical protein